MRHGRGDKETGKERERERQEERKGGRREKGKGVQEREEEGGGRREEGREKSEEWGEAEARAERSFDTRSFYESEGNPSYLRNKQLLWEGMAFSDDKDIMVFKD